MKLNKLVTVFALFLPGIIWLSAASAHTSLITQQPVGNSVIQELPSEVTLTFDEPLIVIGKANSIMVLDPKGNEISIGETKVLNNVVSRAITASEARWEILCYIPSCLRRWPCCFSYLSIYFAR
jgi:methionine-rich copper-binding protein CopC